MNLRTNEAVNQGCVTTEGLMNQSTVHRVLSIICMSYFLLDSTVHQGSARQENP